MIEQLAAATEAQQEALEETLGTDLGTDGSGSVREPPEEPMAIGASSPR